jgi:hypothetical protein
MAMTSKASHTVKVQIAESDLEMLKRVFNIAELIASKTQKKNQQPEQITQESQKQQPVVS